MAVYKVVGLEDAKVGYVSAGVIVYEDIPFINAANNATAVTNLTFEGDATSEIVYVSAELTGTLGFDKLSTGLIEKVYAKQLLVTGNVAKVTVTTAGTGYTTSPTVVFTGGAGTGAAGTATIASGGVTSVIITNHGTGYTSAPTMSFTGGGGTGAVANSTLVSLPAQVTGRLYMGNTQEFAPAPVELVVTAATVNESVTPNRAEKMRLVVPKATISPYKAGNLANRAKQTQEFEWSAIKTTVDINNIALSGVPSDGCNYYLEFINPAA